MPVLHLLVSGISGCSVVPVLTFVVQWHQYLHLLLSGVQWLFIGASTCVCWSVLFSGAITYVCCWVVFSGCSVVAVLGLLFSGVQWLFSGVSTYVCCWAAPGSAGHSPHSLHNGRPSDWASASTASTSLQCCHRNILKNKQLLHTWQICAEPSDNSASTYLIHI